MYVAPYCVEQRSSEDIKDSMTVTSWYSAEPQIAQINKSRRSFLKHILYELEVWSVEIQTDWETDVVQSEGTFLRRDQSQPPLQPA